MMTPISAFAPQAAASGSSGSSSNSNDPSTGLANEQTFLRLLMAQVQNQDPMDPSTDPTQYVTQLAQFSSLEQLTQIHTDLDQLVAVTGTKSN